MPEVEHVPDTSPPVEADDYNQLPLLPENAMFGKYELGKLLGCGAFAKVYHARDTRTGQSVAIKIINKKKIVGTALMSNVKREISIMRLLRHPNIVKLYEVLATKTKIFVVMEFVKGGELFVKVAKGKFSEDLSRKYFQQLISAVGYCHSRGVYHRDLKPENLLLDESGSLKVSDFGLSALTDQIRVDGMLHTLCGTPAYVAPEILSKRGYDGEKVDVWSCGVVLFVLASGFLPFNDPNLMVMYKKIYKGEFLCPKWMSSDLKRFLSRLLDIKPARRITIDEITRNNWFRKGLKDVDFNFYHEEEDFGCKILKDGEGFGGKTMNAFDLISFAPGLNLSGLFDDPCNSEQFVAAAECPELVLQRIEAAARDVENVRLRKRKESSVEVEGRNGDFVLGLEVRLLTVGLVVVEVRRRAGGAAGLYNDLWECKIKPAITGGQQPEAQIAACV